MEKKLVIKKHGEKVELGVYEGRKSHSSYHVILDNNPERLAQILIDLDLVYNYKILEAVQIYLNRVTKKDWLGL